MLLLKVKASRSSSVAVPLLLVVPAPALLYVELDLLPSTHIDFPFVDLCWCHLSLERLPSLPGQIVPWFPEPYHLLYWH